VAASISSVSAHIELPDRLHQQRRSVAARIGGVRDLPAQQVDPCLLEFIQRPRPRHVEQLGRCLERAGQLLRAQHPTATRARFCHEPIQHLALAVTVEQSRPHQFQSLHRD
jgi:hypothetical protein